MEEPTDRPEPAPAGGTPEPEPPPPDPFPGYGEPPPDVRRDAPPNVPRREWGPTQDTAP